MLAFLATTPTLVVAAWYVGIHLNRAAGWYLFAIPAVALFGVYLNYQQRFKPLPSSTHVYVTPGGVVLFGLVIILGAACSYTSRDTISYPNGETAPYYYILERPNGVLGAITSDTWDLTSRELAEFPAATPIESLGKPTVQCQGPLTFYKPVFVHFKTGTVELPNDHDQLVSIYRMWPEHSSLKESLQTQILVMVLMAASKHTEGAHPIYVKVVVDTSYPFAERGVNVRERQLDAVVTFGQPEEVGSPITSVVRLSDLTASEPEKI